MSIPKVIHYCWFGRNPLPKLAERCIASWKKFCPDYEILEWNEDNYDLEQAPLFVKQAYEAKKWAFVTDCVRLQIVYEHGGIYLDTDVELLKPLDPLLTHHAYFGFETDTAVATGLGFGAEKHSPVVGEMLDWYLGRPFIQEDGSFDLLPCPYRNTATLQKWGLQRDGTKQLLKGDILVLPKEYLCPLDDATRRKKVTPRTVSIHWYSASWYTEEEWKQKKKELLSNRLHWITRLPNRLGTALLGKQRYERLRYKILGR